MITSMKRMEIFLVRGTQGITTYTTGVTSSVNEVPNVSGTILAAEINKMIRSVNSARAHYHDITDTYY